MLWTKNHITDQILEEVSSELSIPKQDVAELIDIVFGEVKNIIESAEQDKVETFKSIQITGLGTFKINSSKITKFKKIKEKKKLKNDLENNQSV